MQNRPKGFHIINTRPAAEEDDWYISLEANSFTFSHIPLTQIVFLSNPELESALAVMNSFDWLIFTSGNAVKAVLESASANREMFSGKTKIAAVGPGTAEVLKEAGTQHIFIPYPHHAEALAAQLPARAGERILLPHSAIAPGTLRIALEAKGLEVVEIAAYTTAPRIEAESELTQALKRGAEAVVFFSASAAEAYAGITKRQSVALQHPKLVSIGPSTSAALTAYGFEVAAEASPHTAMGVAEALIKLFKD